MKRAIILRNVEVFVEKFQSTGWKPNGALLQLFYLTFFGFHVLNVLRYEHL